MRFLRSHSRPAATVLAAILVLLVAVMPPAHTAPATVASMVQQHSSPVAEHNATWFRSHYKANLRAPRGWHPRPLVGEVRLSADLPASATVNLGAVDPIGDQSSLGACAAWTSAEALDYAVHTQLGDTAFRASPRFEYDHYADTYQGGADNGSWFDQDLETVPSTGIPTRGQLPYPPFQIDDPIPTTDAHGAPLAADAAQHVYPIVIRSFPYAGSDVVNAMRGEIAAGVPVMLGFNVYPEYDNATAQPLIVPPAAGEATRGGHANLEIGYDDGILMPDGTRGAFLTQNQWGTTWGDTQNRYRAGPGRAWLSYSFVARDLMGAEYLTIDGAPLPTPTPASTPTPRPPATSTPFPSSTAMPTPTHIPTSTPTSTPSPAPTMTPRPSPTSTPAPAAFDIRLYESYARRHHRHLIAYLDGRHRVLKIAAAWMRHRKLCGGAMTAVEGEIGEGWTPLRTQEFQGCQANRYLKSGTVYFDETRPWKR